MGRTFLATLFVAILSSAAFAQTAQLPAPGPAASAASTSLQQPTQADLVPPTASGGIQGQNIFDVKPDASSDPKYPGQTNAERNRVQPGNNAPMWRDVGRGVTGFTSIPKSQDPEAGNLIQPSVQYPLTRYTTAGEAWRQMRNVWIIPYGGSLLLIVLLAIAIFYFTRGPIGHAGPEVAQGRMIERFTPFERATHWANAIAFCILAISGIVMAFGRFFLLPIMGGALFGWLTWVLKTAHNFAGPLFAVSLLIMFITFIKDNWPQKGDLNWLLKAGGLFGGHEPASNRFNMGEKIVFWFGVFLFGSLVVASGLVLDKLLPGVLYDRATMQVSHMVHAVAAVLMMCIFAGHIYLGTVGIRGSYTAMRRGWVDEAWAQEHHAYWAEDVRAGKIPAVRSEPATAQCDPVNAV